MIPEKLVSFDGDPGDRPDAQAGKAEPIVCIVSDFVVYAKMWRRHLKALASLYELSC